MAVVDPTVTKGGMGVTEYSWVLTNGDTGAPIQASPSLKTVTVTGTFGGGTVTIQGSMDDTNWLSMGSDLEFTVAGINTFRSLVGYIRPSSTATTAVITMRCQDTTDCWDLSSTYWDDLTAPATAINPPGAASDPGRESTTGLLRFDASSTELIYHLFHVGHTWNEESDLKPHVHWEKTTSAAGNVAWQLSTQITSIVDGVGQTRSGWTDHSIVSTSSTQDDDTADQQLLTPLATLSMTGHTISTSILARLQRVGGDASDTYAADARLLEFDIHYQRNSLGSILEYAKQ